MFFGKNETAEFVRLHAALQPAPLVLVRCRTEENLLHYDAAIPADRPEVKIGAPSSFKPAAASAAVGCRRSAWPAATAQAAAPSTVASADAASARAGPQQALQQAPGPAHPLLPQQAQPQQAPPQQAPPPHQAPPQQAPPPHQAVPPPHSWPQQQPTRPHVEQQPRQFASFSPFSPLEPMDEGTAVIPAALPPPAGFEAAERLDAPFGGLIKPSSPPVGRAKPREWVAKEGDKKQQPQLRLGQRRLGAKATKQVQAWLAANNKTADDFRKMTEADRLLIRGGATARCAQAWAALGWCCGSEGGCQGFHDADCCPGLRSRCNTLCG